MNIQDFEKSFLPALSRSARDTFSAHVESLIDERWLWFEKFRKILTDARSELGKAASTVTNIQAYGAELQRLLENCEELLAEPGSIPGNPFGELTERFARLTEQIIPDKETLAEQPLSRSFWKRKPEDNFLVRLKKSRYSLKYSVCNLFRKKERRYYGRQSLNATSLLTHYTVQPLLNKALLLEREVMHAFAKQLQEYHSLFEKQLLSLTGKEILDIDKGLINKDRLVQNIEEGEKWLDNLLSGKSREQWKDYLVSEFEKYAGERIEQSKQIIVTAGTPLLPGKKFSASLNASNHKELMHSLDTLTKQWQLFFRGEISDWLKDLEMLMLQVQIINIDHLTKKAILDKYSTQLLPKTDKAISLLSGSLTHLKSLINENEDNIKQHILKENRSMIRDLRKVHIPEVIDAFDQTQILKKLESFRSRIRYRMDGLSEHYSIVESSDPDTFHPKMTVSGIDLKSIILPEFYQPFESRFFRFQDDIEQKISGLLRDLSEISLVIEVNLESALEALHEDDQKKMRTDANQVVIEGLERSENLMKNIRQEMQSLATQVNGELTSLTVQLLSDVRELADNDKIMNLRFRLAKVGTFAGIHRMGQGIANIFRLYIMPVIRWFASNVLMVRTGYSHIKRLTGLESASEENRRALHRLLYTSRSRIEKLPFVYQRLFRLEPLKDERLFSARDDRLEELTETISNWRKGEYSNTVVIGEKGSGRTSLINILVNRSFRAYSVHRLDLFRSALDEKTFTGQLIEVFRLKGITTQEELKDALTSLEKPVVCVVENLHNLYLRTVDGFSLLEKFLLLMSATQKKVFWITTCGTYGWNYLDKVIRISRYFENIVSLSDLNNKTLREVILKRHRLSGYNLHYLPSVETRQNRKFRRLKDEKQKQNYLSDLYFSQLNALAGGNISIAFLLWQLSIKDFKNDKLFINDKIEFATGLLNLLPQDEVFTLGALMEHEVLTEDQHARIFNMDGETSLLILGSMLNRGLLVKTGSGYHIHLLLYKEVVRLLTDKNIIH
ncbi:MAG: ATP-binding protein [Bacteroidetes bacterium]|nr:ATP-binding protein [Bacteroidota bacterium]